MQGFIHLSSYCQVIDTSSHNNSQYIVHLGYVLNIFKCLLIYPTMERQICALTSCHIEYICAYRKPRHIWAIIATVGVKPSHGCERVNRLSKLCK